MLTAISGSDVNEGVFGVFQGAVVGVVAAARRHGERYRHRNGVTITLWQIGCAEEDFR